MSVTEDQNSNDTHQSHQAGINAYHTTTHMNEIQEKAEQEWHKLTSTVWSSFIRDSDGTVIVWQIWLRWQVTEHYQYIEVYPKQTKEIGLKGLT